MDSKDSDFHSRCQRLKVLIPALLTLVALLACSLSGSDNPPLPTDAPTPTVVAGGPTFAPLVTVTPHALSTAQATLPTQVKSCTADKTALGARYEINATVDLDAHSANAVMRATYRNDTGQPLPQIVMNVEPNRRPGVF